MANTIRIGTFEVSSFKVGLKDPKIYLGDILLYPTGGYKVCYAVVDDITQYQETEFEDVYDKETEKWYKLNNLSQYEEYGIYASGRTICEGSTSRLPQGYTEVEYIENTSTAYIDTGAYIDTSNFEIGYTITDKQQLFGYCHQGCGNCTWLGVEQSAIMWWGKFDNNANLSSYLTSGDNIIIFTQSGATINGTSISKTFIIGSDDISNVSLPIFARYDFKDNTMEHRTDSYMQLKSFYLKNNGTLVRDLVPAKRDSDSKYGMYDLVTNTFYLSPNNVDFSGGEPITPTDCVTTYNGKLTIDDGYEYEWNGSSWVNVGEVSGSSVVEYIETPTSSPYAGIELLTSPSSQSTPMYYEVDCLVKSNQGDNSILGQKSERETVSYQFGFQAYNSPYYDYGGRRLSTNWSSIGGLNNRIKVGFGVNSGDSKVVIKNLDTSTIVQSTTATPKNVTIPLLCNAKYNTSGDTYATSGQVRYYEIKIYDNNVLVGNYIPAKNPSTNEYTFYETISQRYCSKIGTGTIAGHEETHYEYPKYYSEKSEPLDNLTFNTMAEAEAYECPWVGMHAKIDGDRYIFSGDSQSGYEWVEDTNHYLPDIPYSFNYNAKQYIASTYTIPQTEGQLQNVDAVCNYGYKIVDHSADSYISVTGNSRMILSGNNGTYLNRSNTQANCPMTIISKAKTTSGYSIFTDRNSSSRQYMYRQDKTYAYLCGTGNTSLDSCICSDSIPSILSVRVYYDSGIKAKWNNWTTSASSTPEGYAYNNQSLTNGGALFCDYSNSNSEFWQGDFYWIYMSQTELTDEQIQQVIDYNENL